MYQCIDVTTNRKPQKPNVVVANVAASLSLVSAEVSASQRLSTLDNNRKYCFTELGAGSHPVFKIRTRIIRRSECKSECFLNIVGFIFHNVYILLKLL